MRISIRGSVRMLFFDNKNAGRSKEIRPQTAAERDPVPFLKGDLFYDPDLPFSAQFPEIADGSQVNICRIIPLHGESPGNRHIPKRNLDSCAPVTDIDEADDSPSSDPEHFIQDHIGTFHSLEGLTQNHEVKRK